MMQTVIHVALKPALDVTYRKDDVGAKNQCVILNAVGERDGEEEGTLVGVHVKLEVPNDARISFRSGLLKEALFEAEDETCGAAQPIHRGIADILEAPYELTTNGISQGKMYNALREAYFFLKSVCTGKQRVEALRHVVEKVGKRSEQAMLLVPLREQFRIVRG